MRRAIQYGIVTMCAAWVGCVAELDPRVEAPAQPPATALPQGVLSAAAQTPTGASPLASLHTPPASGDAEWTDAEWSVLGEFEGVIDPLRGTLELFEVGAPSTSAHPGVVGDLATREQPAWCAPRVVVDGAAGVGPANSVEVYTDATGIFRAGPGEPVPPACAVGNTALYGIDGVLCAPVRVMNFYGAGWEDVYVQLTVFSGDATNLGAYPYPLGTGAAPPGDLPTPGGTLGLWSYGDIGPSGAAQTVVWTFRNASTSQTRFRGRVLAHRSEVCANAIDDDCDGRIDNGCGAYGLGADCTAPLDCASGACIAGLCVPQCPAGTGGPSCVSCPGTPTCSNNGTCDEGRNGTGLCVCDPGQHGADCAASCSDGVRNGLEVTIDCGGPCATPATGCADVCSPGSTLCDPAQWSRIEPGTFVFGSPTAELGRYTHEPQRTVTLSHAFWIGRHEILRPAWVALMGLDRSMFGACGANCAVDQLTWYEALEAANRLSELEGLPPCYDLSGPVPQVTALSGSVYDCAGFRLPTEAEWEFAARGGTTGATWLGELENTNASCSPGLSLDAIASHCGNSANTQPPAGVRAANPYGVFDMLGGVAEWVWDGYVFQNPATLDPATPPATEQTVRGGSWMDPSIHSRAAWRWPVAPTLRRQIGARLVRTVDATPWSGCVGGGPLNACGGCAELALPVGAPCGACGTGAVACAGTNDVVCVGATPPNGCGGCNTLPQTLGAVCSACSNGSYLWECTSDTTVGCAAGCGGSDMVRVPGGTFLRGSPPSEGGRNGDEALRGFTITRGLWVQTAEVTQTAWESTMGTQPWAGPDCANCPVESVSFVDALAYANARSIAEGLAPCFDLATNPVGVLTGSGSVVDCEGYRLPTETEWEYLARAGSGNPNAYTTTSPTQANCAAGATTDAYAWTCANATGPRPVAQLAPNAWGLYDMHGNVAELVYDAYAAVPNSDTPPFNDPVFAYSVASAYQTRGGSWLDVPASMRTARRNAGGSATSASHATGFRLVRTSPP